MKFAPLTAVASIVFANPAIAGETILYQPTPDWVAATPPLAASSSAPDAPRIMVFDAQVRFAGGTVWTYLDTAGRISSPEELAQVTSATVTWFPDKGDLMIHELAILRDGQAIDLLKAGTKFDVLRREEGLERNELNGILTATARVESLRVGDILRFRYSTTLTDPALAARGQAVMRLLALPTTVGFGRVRASWPAAEKVAWRIDANEVAAVPVRKGAGMELVVNLPVARQHVMPQDAPARFMAPPFVEFSSFAGWADVSKTMAPLYETEGLVTPDGEIAAEIARIRGATTDPLQRAQAALHLVQDRIRYLMIGMDGGNYVPMKPEETWRVRYGDCKAKTLLLLAILRAMDIEAEPVLAAIGSDDLVPERVPSALAFNHVFVRASVAGRDIWLDGTGSGARIEDIGDAPLVRNLLPLRKNGADLIVAPVGAPARPVVDIAVAVDESSSLDLPSVFDATVIVRGPTASGIKTTMGTLDEKRRREALSAFFNSLLGESLYSEITFTPDEDAATLTLKATGAGSTPWRRTDGKFRRPLGKALERMAFEPDRSKREWSGIPVATGQPATFAYRLDYRPPDQGRGYTIEGEADAAGDIAGRVISRKLTFEDGRLALAERIGSTGAEIPAAAIAETREKVALAKARQPVLIAPGTATRRWNLDEADKAATQHARIEAIYARAITFDPDKPEGYLSRANLRRGIGDFKGARTDLDKALQFADGEKTYLQRASINASLGDFKAAIADARAARAINPGSIEANNGLASYLAMSGDLAGAIALLDERIALGGSERDKYREFKAGVVGEYGNPDEALALVAEQLKSNPNNSGLFNSNCWIKATRQVQIETALKDCNRAIELSSSPVAALDSRALVWFRLGRLDDALADLDLALEQAPDLAPSRVLRGIVLGRLGRKADAAHDIAIAQRLAPGVVRTYARYGLVP